MERRAFLRLGAAAAVVTAAGCNPRENRRPIERTTEKSVNAAAVQTTLNDLGQQMTTLRDKMAPDIQQYVPYKLPNGGLMYEHTMTIKGTQTDMRTGEEQPLEEKRIRTMSYVQPPQIAGESTFVDGISVQYDMVNDRVESVSFYTDTFRGAYKRLDDVHGHPDTSVETRLEMVKIDDDTNIGELNVLNNAHGETPRPGGMWATDSLISNNPLTEADLTSFEHNAEVHLLTA